MKDYMSDEQLRSFLRKNNRTVILTLIREFARAQTREQQLSRRKQTRQFIISAKEALGELS